jgi:hypothetical protein
MNERVLKQAQAWGFICKEIAPSDWQILPPQRTERWSLKLFDDKWLLIVGEVPQISLHPYEALEFLERRRFR